MSQEYPAFLVSVLVICGILQPFLFCKPAHPALGDSVKTLRPLVINKPRPTLSRRKKAAKRPRFVAPKLFQCLHTSFAFSALAASSTIAATPLVALMGTLLHSTVPLSTGIFIYF